MIVEWLNAISLNKKTINTIDENKNIRTDIKFILNSHHENN